MTEVTITLPYPPTVNHYKTIGRTVVTKSGKAFQQRINSEKTKRYFYEVWFKIQHLKAKEGLKSFDSAIISLEVDVYPPDKRRRDLSNILKVLEDSLQKAGLYNDDYQISRLVVERKGIIPQGQIVVRVKAL